MKLMRPRARWCICAASTRHRRCGREPGTPCGPWALTGRSRHARVCHQLINRPSPLFLTKHAPCIPPPLLFPPPDEDAHAPSATPRPTQGTPPQRAARYSRPSASFPPPGGPPPLLAPPPSFDPPPASSTICLPSGTFSLRFPLPPTPQPFTFSSCFRLLSLPYFAKLTPRS